MLVAARAEVEAEARSSGGVRGRGVSLRHGSLVSPVLEVEVTEGQNVVRGPNRLGENFAISHVADSAGVQCLVGCGDCRAVVAVGNGCGEGRRSAVAICPRGELYVSFVPLGESKVGCKEE